MARRKAFKLGPKRRSYGKAFRVNTKGGRITSVSAGGGGFRVNTSKRGTRVSRRTPRMPTSSRGCFSSPFLLIAAALMGYRLLRRA